MLENYAGWNTENKKIMLGSRKSGKNLKNGQNMKKFFVFKYCSDVTPQIQ